MNYYSTQITNLIEELRRLPGIGSKSAQRLAFHIINMPEEHVHHLAQTLVTAREKIRYCKYCCTLTDSEVCPICARTKRDHSPIMVVEHTQDLAAYEKTGQYHGVYHVLQGTLAPSLGKGPDDIRFKELEERLNNPEVKELILATNSSLDGEATAMYITKKVKPRGIKVTRIASGVPIGGGIHLRSNTLTSFRWTSGTLKQIILTTDYYRNCRYLIPFVKFNYQILDINLGALRFMYFTTGLS